MLNKDQRIAMRALKSGKNVFLSGEAGTGKSYVLNQFLAESKDKNIIVCAPTGIAAINVNGSTLHRVFKVPLEPISPTFSPKKPSDTLIEADIIVIDEISMCRFDCFEFVAKSIRKAEEWVKIYEEMEAEEEERKPRELPPKQLIVVGDFFQLPPVITEKDRPILEKYWSRTISVGDGFAFQAPMWRQFDFVTVVLTEVVRQKGEVDFVTNLNKIRRGDKSGIPWFNANAAKKKQNGIFLAPTNKGADKINQTEVVKLKGRSQTYEAVVDGKVSASDKPTADKLQIKEGMQVMSLTNDMEGQYQNGSIGIVKSMTPSAVTVDFGNHTAKIPYYIWEIYDYEVKELPDGSTRVEKIVIGTFEQIPLKVAYAITIHKSQGQTYDAGNVSPACFAAGQLYVALSRVKSIKKLHLTTKIKDEHLITSRAVLDFYDYGITSFLLPSDLPEPEPEKAEIDNVTNSTPEPAEPKEKSSPKKDDDIVTKSKTSQKKQKHGGNREGAGRKRKYGGKTITIRIPESAKEAVQELLASREWE